MTDRPRRVTLVADELLGYVRTGGIGTATTHLALALARMGHDVDVLYAGDAAPHGDWHRVYDEAGIRLRALEPAGMRVGPGYLARAFAVGLALGGKTRGVGVHPGLGAP